MDDIEHFYYLSKTQAKNFVGLLGKERALLCIDIMLADFRRIHNLAPSPVLSSYILRYELVKVEIEENF